MGQTSPHTARLAKLSLVVPVLAVLLSVGYAEFAFPRTPPPGQHDELNCAALGLQGYVVLLQSIVILGVVGSIGLCLAATSLFISEARRISCLALVLNAIVVALFGAAWIAW